MCTTTLASRLGAVLAAQIPGLEVSADPAGLKITHAQRMFRIGVTYNTDDMFGTAQMSTTLTQLDPDDGSELGDFPIAASSQVMLPGTKGRLDVGPASVAICAALGGSGR